MSIVDSEYLGVGDIQTVEGFEPLCLFSHESQRQMLMHVHGMQGQFGKIKKRDRTRQLGTCHGGSDAARQGQRQAGLEEAGGS